MKVFNFFSALQIWYFVSCACGQGTKLTTLPGQNSISNITKTISSSEKESSNYFAKTTTLSSKESAETTIKPQIKALEIKNKKEIGDKPKYNTASVSTELICPTEDVKIPFFSIPCFRTDNCKIFGKDLVCCSNRCIKGISPPEKEIVHDPTWFGLIERRCPVEPLAELWEIKECKTDADCSPRICCSEKKPNGTTGGKYCRTAEPILDKVPAAKRLFEPLKTIVGYMQCTPPPPPILDIFPKPCQNPLDCFPNLCCQEQGHKYCRPPKRSLLTLIAGVGQRIVPEDAARKFIERLN